MSRSDAPDPEDGQDEQEHAGTSGDGDERPPDPFYAADGLDLARSAMRSAAGSTAPPARKDPSSRRGALPPGAGAGAGANFGANAAGDGRRRGRIRPGEAQMSGAHPDGRDPQAVGAELERLIGVRGWALDLQVRGVFARWTEIVGPEIGAHSTPETLLDGVLVVRTDSTAWATQLKLFAATVVRRLNEELGEGTVTVVEVLGPHAPSWKHGRRSARGSRGPRDTYG